MGTPKKVTIIFGSSKRSFQLLFHYPYVTPMILIYIMRTPKEVPKFWETPKVREASYGAAQRRGDHVVAREERGSVPGLLIRNFDLNQSLY